jgi:SPP1 gp7 family putative phage head morphogenesis protein
VKRAVLNALLTDKNTVVDEATALQAANSAKAHLNEVMPVLLLRVLAATGDAAARTFNVSNVRTAELMALKRPPKTKFKMEFVAANPQAVAWAQSYSYELIQGITAETAAAIAVVIADSYTEGRTVVEIGKILRKTIGLNVNQTKRVLRMRAEMIARGWLQDKIDREVDKLTAKLIRERALTIAHTETMRASNKGIKMLWAQAQAKGLLTGHEKQQWVFTEDEKACEQCEELDGTVVEMEGEFAPGVTEPPAHPNCRCRVALVLPEVPQWMIDEELAKRQPKVEVEPVEEVVAAAEQRDAAFDETLRERVPAGSPDGGQWTSGDSAAVAEIDPGTLPPGLQKWIKERQEKGEKIGPPKGQLPPGLQKWKAEQERLKQEKLQQQQQPQKPEPPQQQQQEQQPPQYPTAPDRGNSNDPKVSEARLVANDIADKMGFERDRIDIVNDATGYRFNLDGRESTAAGHFEPSTGMVQINVAHCSSSALAGVVIHEIAHAQFAGAERTLNDETWQISKLADRGTKSDGQYGVRNPHFTQYGQVKVAYRSDYLQNHPTVAAWHEAGIAVGILNTKSDVAGLIRDDGVSQYSERWWNAVKAEVASGKYTNSEPPTLRSAINETLAEAARIMGGRTWIFDKSKSQVANSRFGRMRSAVLRAYNARDKHAEAAHYTYMAQNFADKSIILRSQGKP